MFLYFIDFIKLIYQSINSPITLRTFSPRRVACKSQFTCMFVRKDEVERVNDKS